MQTILIAGGAGGVGEGIVRALLARTAATLVVTSRDAARLEQLAARAGGGSDLSRLIPIVGNAGDPAGAAAIAARIRAEIGPLDIAIPSLGGWWQGGPLLDVDLATWNAVMLEMLDTHFVFARTFIPELARRPGGWYLAIGGGAAFHPVPGASIVSIAAAAQVMLTRALAAENAGVRINEFVVNGPVRTRESESIAAPGWITADQVGEVVAALVRGEPPPWAAYRERGPLLIMDPASRG